MCFGLFLALSLLFVQWNILIGLVSFWIHKIIFMEKTERESVPCTWDRVARLIVSSLYKTPFLEQLESLISKDTDSSPFQELHLGQHI